MITNTPSFETNFQALPEDIQNKIKGYVPNVIDRTSQLQSNIKAIPEDIRNYIKGYVPNMVDHASRNKLYSELQAETDQKMGLYGENLILKGLLLCDQLFEAEQNWNFRKIELENEIATDSLPKKHWYSPVPTLFTNAINNPKGKSLKALNMLYYTNYGAAEALRQLDMISLNKISVIDVGSNFKENSERINNLLQKIRQQRTTEQTIYNVCGGKNKFHDLKILPWEDAKDLKMYTKIQEGETVMRGLDDNGLPFITISLQKPGNVFLMLQQQGLLTETNTCSLKDYEDCKLLNTITVLKQDYDTPTKWTNYGISGLMHSDEGDSVNEFGIKTGETGSFYIENKNEMKYSQYSTTYNLFPTLKELLTTGSCLYDAENPDRGMFKLTKQG